MLVAARRWAQRMKLFSRRVGAGCAKSEAGDENSRPTSTAIYLMEGQVRGLPCLIIRNARQQRPYSIVRVGTV